MAIIQTTNKSNRKQRKLNDLFTFTTTSTTRTTTTTTSTISSNSSSLQASTSSSFSSLSSESMMDENIKNAESIIQKWKINGDSSSIFISIFHENKKEATYFINCVKGLHRAMHFLATHDTKSNKLIVAQRLMQIAMKRLEREFHLILLNRDYLEPESVSSLSSQSNIDSEDGCYLKQPSMMVAIPNLRLIEVFSNQDNDKCSTF